MLAGNGCAADREFAARSGETPKQVTEAPWYDDERGNLSAIFGLAMRRVRGWCTPPNWSSGGWLQEATQIARIAACRAASDYDPTRGVPLACHIQQRIVARVRTRFRQEWFYALRFISEMLHDSGSTEGESPEQPSRPDIAPTPHENTLADLREAVADLPEPQRQLIEHIFWHGHTENELALVLGISQRAVNKRKQAALESLRADL